MSPLITFLSESRRGLKIILSYSCIITRYRNDPANGLACSLIYLRYIFEPYRLLKGQDVGELSGQKLKYCSYDSAPFILLFRSIQVTFKAAYNHLKLLVEAPA